VPICRPNVLIFGTEGKRREIFSSLILFLCSFAAADPCHSSGQIRPPPPSPPPTQDKAAAAAAMEKPCSLLVHFDKGSAAMANAIKADLEGSDGAAKADAMRRAISLLLNGETLPQLFITIVRYVLPSEDHTVQKLLLLYLETIERRDRAGRALPEMILICQNLCNNHHPFLHKVVI
jgi:coatomer subunit beta